MERDIDKWTIHTSHLRSGMMIDRLIFVYNTTPVVAAHWNTVQKKYTWMNAGTGVTLQMPEDFADADVRMLRGYDIKTT